MTRPPTLPAGFVDSPVTPHEAQQARAGVQRSGDRLQTGLTALTALGVLSGGLALAGLAWLRTSLPGLLLAWGLPLTPAEAQEFRDVMQAIPGWFWAVTALLTLLGTALNVWCLGVIRRAVGGLQAWTLAPTPERAAGLVRQARTLRPWLTLGQWFPLVTGGLTLLLYAALFSVSGLGTGSDMAETAIPVVASLVSSLASLLPGALIAWLGLGALKRWLDAVVTRTGDAAFPVRPFARSLDGWLVFTLVLLGLGLLNLLGATAVLAFFPSFLTWLTNMEGSAPPADAQTLRLIGNLMRAAALFPLFGGLVYALLALLVYWSRQFTGSVARLLDAARPAPVSPPSLAPARPDW